MLKFKMDAYFTEMSNRVLIEGLTSEDYPPKLKSLPFIPVISGTLITPKPLHGIADLLY